MNHTSVAVLYDHDLLWEWKILLNDGIHKYIRISGYTRTFLYTVGMGHCRLKMAICKEGIGEVSGKKSKVEECTKLANYMYIPFATSLLYLL